MALPCRLPLRGVDDYVLMTACWLPLRGVDDFVLLMALPCRLPLRGVDDCVLTAVRLINSEANQHAVINSTAH